jgi:hypothetical protein
MIRIGADPEGETRAISKRASPRHLVSDETKLIGPAALSDDALLRACRNAHKPWIKCGKYFREAYKRAKEGRIPGVRTQADLCRSVGCSLRWLQLVMTDAAADSNKHKNNIKNPGPASGTAEPKSDEAYADDITRYPQRELESLMHHEPEQFRELCRALANAFSEAAKRIQPRGNRVAHKGAHG